jgi:hypothetical protein
MATSSSSSSSSHSSSPPSSSTSMGAGGRGPSFSNISRTCATCSSSLSAGVAACSYSKAPRPSAYASLRVGLRSDSPSKTTLKRLLPRLCTHPHHPTYLPRRPESDPPLSSSTLPHRAKTKPAPRGTVPPSLHRPRSPDLAGRRSLGRKARIPAAILQRPDARKREVRRPSQGRRPARVTRLCLAMLGRHRVATGRAGQRRASDRLRGLRDRCSGRRIGVVRRVFRRMVRNCAGEQRGSVTRIWPVHVYTDQRSVR